MRFSRVYCACPAPTSAGKDRQQSATGAMRMAPAVRPAPIRKLRAPGRAVVGATLDRTHHVQRAAGVAPPRARVKPASSVCAGGVCPVDALAADDALCQCEAAVRVVRVHSTSRAFLAYSHVGSCDEVSDSADLGFDIRGSPALHCGTKRIADHATKHSAHKAIVHSWHQHHPQGEVTKHENS